MMAEPSVSACFALRVALAAARESAVCLTSASKSDCSRSYSSSASSVAWRDAVASASFFAADSAWSRQALGSAIDIFVNSRRMSWDICGQR